METKLTIALPKLHKAQARMERGAKRFTIVCAGRRFGKDVWLQRRVIFCVAKGGAQGWFAPTYRTMTENYKELHDRLAIITTRTSATEHRIELRNGAVIEFWSLDNYNAARGRKYAHATINEAAASPNLVDAWNYVIRPTLADLRGGADFASTPKGLNGFFSLWQLAVDNAEWARFHATTYANPFIPPDEIDAMRASLPERVFKQEIMAEFVEDGGYFQRVDAAAVIGQPDQPEAHAGHYLAAGVDWALSEDFTVIAIACRDCNRVVDWLRFNQLDFTYQREKLYDICSRWSVTSVLPERNSIGEPNIELIREHVSVMSGPDGRPGYQTTATSKPPLIQGLATALEHSQFRVPTAFGDELRAYQVETMASGHPKFGAPQGQHDDAVIALALAWNAISTPAGAGLVTFA